MDIESELLKSIPKEELEDQISKRVKSFHGLLTREVAMRLIAKEKGLLKAQERFCTLSGIEKGGRSIGFSAKVRKIWPVAVYSSGKRSRVVEVEDDTGAKPLVLWNEDVELCNGLRMKDEIIVKGAYEKGGELHLGYSGTLEVCRKAPFSALQTLEDGLVVHVRGVVARIEGRDRFMKDGAVMAGYSFIVSDGVSERRCILFGGIDRAEKLKPGDEIIIEGGKVVNGNVEIDADSRMLIRRAKEMLLGTIRSIDCVGERVDIDVEGRQVSLDRPNALRLIGVDVADDITMSTVVSLKKDTLLNSRIAIKIEEKNGQIQVRD